MKHSASCEYALGSSRSISPNNTASKNLLDATIPDLFLGNDNDDPNSIATAQADLNMQHLSLLVYFFVGVLPSLTHLQNPRTREMWVKEAPVSACRYQFLMYSNLAIVCSHIIVTSTRLPALDSNESSENRMRRRALRSHYAALCLYYRQRAFELFRAALAGNTKDVELLRAALFASVLLSIDGFAFPEGSGALLDLEEEEVEARQRDGRTNHARRQGEQKISSIDIWIPLHLGIGAFLREFESMGVTLGEIHESWVLNWDILPLNKPYFNYLSDNIARTYGPAAVDLCQQPITALERILTLQTTAEGASAMSENWIVNTTGGSIERYLLAWPFTCTTEFLHRLREHEPPMLIIYLHYLSVLRYVLCPQRWWAVVTTRRDILAIIASLPGIYDVGGKDRWRDWVKWPLAHLDFDVLVEIG